MTEVNRTNPRRVKEPVARGTKTKMRADVRLSFVSAAAVKKERANKTRPPAGLIFSPWHQE